MVIELNPTEVRIFLCLQFCMCYRMLLVFVFLFDFQNELISYTQILCTLNLLDIISKFCTVALLITVNL
jgi:hypothetical protein